MTTHRRKARRLLQAATLTTKDRAVAQREQNPTPRLKAIGGGEADSWNRRIGQRLGEALPDFSFAQFCGGSPSVTGRIDRHKAERPNRGDDRRANRRCSRGGDASATVSIAS